ncbi:hypothetical protein G647_07342 [Cladophialophora carrionii CBS 160.54]|uniref:Sulfotransferase domain-containing protein n=1 Tax=Cladophialophora carrionii CBS 160.54 TaxID=1279043 RepID=V9D253_9EURO|nr:uncharacterized protein G647_07342 [Cladophialophora carrionii CBS 160.54]ETI20999.1 hypothetical protein G647_07342 [Cladophialophora carrionii CBS 160.54]
MAGIVSTTKHKRVFLLTHPRTASNLLVRILNLENQPALGRPDDGAGRNAQFEYFFVSTVPLRIKLADQPSLSWSEDERTEAMQRLQASADGLLRHLEEAEAGGRSVFVKEHLLWMLSPQAEDLVKRSGNLESRFWKVKVPGGTPVQGGSKAASYVSNHRQAGVQDKEATVIENQTVFPDSFLRTWTPTFLIRHPALVFPSLYRTSVDLEGRDEARNNAGGMFRIEMTWRWSRQLWEWYNKEWQEGNTTLRPIILDADDIILEPQIITTYCKLVGLDAEKCRFEWERAGAEEEASMNFMERKMKSSLLSSAGIIRDGKVAAGLDMRQEVRKWSQEFGEEEARKIEAWVTAAMLDYEFLWERRLRV